MGATFTGHTYSFLMQVLGIDGEPEDVSQGYGLCVRQHDDVMLSSGFSKFVSSNFSLTSGQFAILRLDTGDVVAHHSENRYLSVYDGSAKFSIIEVDDDTEFPANPIELNIINKQGPEILTGTKAKVYTYAVQSSNPFTMNKVFDDEVPVYGAVGRGFSASQEGTFSAVRGRHYTPNKTYAIIIESLDSIDVHYRYEWHDYE